MYKPNLPNNVEPLEWVGPDAPAYEESGLIHAVHIPAEATTAEPAPLILMVHGWAGNEGVMWLFKQTLPQGVAVITPRAPLTVEDGSYIWFEYRTESRLKPEPKALNGALDTLQQFLESLPDLYPVDLSRLVLIGFSQGAMICNSFVVSHPFEAIAVASLAGAMPPLPDFTPHPNILAGLPVFIGHGERDDVIPVSAAQEARDLYHKLGADVTYHEYSTAHKINRQGMQDLKTWLAGIFSD